MEIYNAAVLAAEGIVYFVGLISLLHFRQRIGVGVFITVLGTMHFLETYLAATFYVAVPFGLISPGSSVLFTGKLLMILLLYMREDAPTVRQLIYGLLIGNLLIFLLAQILNFHPAILAPDGAAASNAFLNDLGILMLWGTSLLYLDSLGIILIYERLGSLIGRRPMARFLISGVVTLAFDQIGFYGVLHYLTGAPQSVFWVGLVAKWAMTALFAVFTWIYLRYFAHKRRKADPRPIGDLFDDLTYREKYQDLLSRSGTDPLTGVRDRGRLELEGPLMVRKSLMADRPVTVMVVDADHFKQINDQFGHLYGDEVLKRIAGELQRNVRSNDFVFRFGGEEFVIIAEAMDHATAIESANRLGKSVRQTIHAGDRSVTVSIGVATAPADGQTLVELISAADKRLYQAKAEGRDRIRGA